MSRLDSLFDPARDLHVRRTVRAMARVPVLAAAALGATLVCAAPAAADPVVPGLATDAVAGAPCDRNDRFVFGTDASGVVFSCGVPATPGVWVPISGLLGVREIGADCFAEVVESSPNGSGWTAAQSPDGLPLFCSYPTDSWAVHPTR